MRKDVTIFAPLIQAHFGAMRHHCPFCNQTFEFMDFRDHLERCISEHPEHPAIRERAASEAASGNDH